MKRLIYLLAVVLALVGILYLGGYNFTSFSRSVEFRKPNGVFTPLTEVEPTNTLNFSSDEDLEETLPSFTYTENTLFPMENTDETLPNIGNADIDNPFTDATDQIDLTFTRVISVSIGGQTVELETTTSASFVRWLACNYNGDITLTGANGEIINPEAEETLPIESSETISESDITPMPTINPALVDIVEVSYDDILLDESHLYALIDDIEIVDELPNYDELTTSGEWPFYDRQVFERPVHSYMLGGVRFNRNDYAWATSRFLVSQDPYEYICPYTNQTITDESTLDYDHIVPLKSAYIRGAWAWSNEQRNAYAYDQWVAVDVLNSANRSKSDKGPMDYLPEYNVEDYCYSWLLICSEYDLVMTDEEVDLCQQYILEALRSGETVEHLGGAHYEAA